MSMSCQRLHDLRSRVREMESRYGRPPGSVRVLAVSKTRSAAEIRELAEAGQRCFGENYMQEALEKIQGLADLGLEWHFIGALQSNKTRAVAETFAWVHTVEREKIARRLNDQRRPDQPPLNVCIQVNISGEQTKAGIDSDHLAELAAAVRALPKLRLRGLMALPAPAGDITEQRSAFSRLRRLCEQLDDGAGDLDTLSMGTSGDFEAAIAEGATLIRIGTALFGPRRAQ